MRRAADIVGAENATVVSDASEFGHLSYLEPSKAHDVCCCQMLQSLLCTDHRLQMFHVTAEDFFVSSAVVAPRTVPDVQTLVRLANEFEVPLWPFVSSSTVVRHTAPGSC